MYIPRRGDRYIFNKDFNVLCLKPFESRAKRITIFAGDEIVFAEKVTRATPIFPFPFILIRHTDKNVSKIFANPYNFNTADTTLVKHKSPVSIEHARAEFDENVFKRLSRRRTAIHRRKAIKKAFIQRLKSAYDGTDILIRASLFEMLHTLNNTHKVKTNFWRKFTLAELTFPRRWTGRIYVKDNKTFVVQYKNTFLKSLSWLFEGELDDKNNVIDNILLPMPIVEE